MLPPYTATKNAKSIQRLRIVLTANGSPYATSVKEEVPVCVIMDVACTLVFHVVAQVYVKNTGEIVLHAPNAELGRGFAKSTNNGDPYARVVHAV